MANNYGDIAALNDECQKIAVDSRSKVDEKKAEMGILGRLFGSSKNSAYNIACLTIVLCLLVGLGGMAINICKGAEVSLEPWKALTSVITLAFGYLFGIRNSK